MQQKQKETQILKFPLITYRQFRIKTPQDLTTKPSHILSKNTQKNRNRSDNRERNQSPPKLGIVTSFDGNKIHFYIYIVYSITYLVLLHRKQSRSLEQAYRRRGQNRPVYKLDSLKSSSMVPTNRLRLRIGGTYRVRGTAEKATAKNNCNMTLFCRLERERGEGGIGVLGIYLKDLGDFRFLNCGWAGSIQVL